MLPLVWVCCILPLTFTTGHEFIIISSAEGRLDCFRVSLDKITAVIILKYCFQLLCRLSVMQQQASVLLSFHQIRNQELARHMCSLYFLLYSNHLHVTVI